MKRVSVIVPHGDDEVLMCGGTIQKHVKNGDHVTCVFLEEASDDRSEKRLTSISVAKKVLSYQDVILLKLSDVVISDIRQLTCVMEKLLLTTTPNIIYTTHWGDNHFDHQMTFKAVSTACRTWGPHSPDRLLCGEILSSTDQSPQLMHTAFLPNYYNVLNSEEINNKNTALKWYFDEIKTSPHPRSLDGITRLATIRGSECGHEFAESFVTIKDTNK
jgi:LmbE family N-acetylglucosaminyl deacetylase